MTDLGLNTDFPLHFRENHTQVYSFPLAAESKITYLCSRKTSNNPQKNLDYETYIISNRSGNRDDNIRERPETYQHSG